MPVDNIKEGDILLIRENKDCSQIDAISFKMLQKNYIGNGNLKLILKNRNKRGLTNIIGSAANFMFGTLDQEDKENLEKLIKNLDNKPELEFFKKQTKIISSTSIELKNNRNMINNHTKIINEIIKSEGKELDIHSSHDLVSDEVYNIEKAIVDIQHGILNPNIISKKVVFKLQEIFFEKINVSRKQCKKSGTKC